MESLTVDKLASVADKILEVQSPANIFQFSEKAQTSKKCTELECIQKQVNALSQKFEHVFQNNNQQGQAQQSKTEHGSQSRSRLEHRSSK